MDTNDNNKMPKEEVVLSLAELFKALGDPTRVKILSCLKAGHSGPHRTGHGIQHTAGNLHLLNEMIMVLTNHQ